MSRLRKNYIIGTKEIRRLKSEDVKKKYQDIGERTFNFATQVIKMVNQLPPCTATFELGK
jgi:hypothetical protein